MTANRKSKSTTTRDSLTSPTTPPPSDSIPSTSQRATTTTKRCLHLTSTIGITVKKSLAALRETLPHTPPLSTSTPQTPSNCLSPSPTRKYVNSHVTTLGHTPSTRCCEGLRTLASTQRCRAYATSYAYKTVSNVSWMTYDDRRGHW